VHVVSGPYLQAVGEREFTVVWTTNIDAVSWVEIAPDDGTHFYNTERPKYYQVLNGRRPIGKLHVVTVSGLEPATTYRYRVMQNGVLVNEGRKRVIFGEGFGSDILRHKPFEEMTLDRSKSEVAFSVVNDMHEHDSILRVLYKDVKPGKYDFVCFNGDMTTSIDAESELMDHYLTSSSELFASDTPLYVARGNHENRGTFAMEWMNYFPSSTGRPYFSFRQGPVYFIVLDSGEDKPDSDIRNMDLMRSDDFRAEEAEWLARVVEEPDFKSAPVRIVFCHMPPAPGGWHGGSEVARLFRSDSQPCGHRPDAVGPYPPLQILGQGRERLRFPRAVQSQFDPYGRKGGRPQHRREDLRCFGCVETPEQIYEIAPFADISAAPFPDRGTAFFIIGDGLLRDFRNLRLRFGHRVPAKRISVFSHRRLCLAMLRPRVIK